jgi:hypothetical protein
MRQDFNKVLVDCYRVGGGSLKPGRQPRDLDDLPKRQGMRNPYRIGHWDTAKDFGENLSPLFRYLEKQVGRPWDKVYSTICQNFDMRKTINQHILQHVNQYIQQDTFMEDGRVMERGYNNESRPLKAGQLYVHPKTRLLCRARKRGPNKREREAAQAREIATVRRHVHNDVWLVKYEDNWYFVKLAKKPAPVKKPYERTLYDGTKQMHYTWDYPHYFDVLFKRSTGFDWLTRKKMKLEDLCYAYYGSRDLYAVWKRQASHQDLKAHGLA